MSLRSHSAGATCPLRYSGALQLPMRPPTAQLWSSKDASRLSRGGALPSMRLSNRQGLPLSEAHCQECTMQPIPSLVRSTLRCTPQLRLPPLSGYLPHRWSRMRSLRPDLRQTATIVSAPMSGEVSRSVVMPRSRAMPSRHHSSVCMWQPAVAHQVRRIYPHAQQGEVSQVQRLVHYCPT